MRKPAITVLLSALLTAALLLTACHKAPGGETTPAPSPESPALPESCAFDPLTRAYEDEHIAFTLPEGQTVVSDGTAGVYSRYLTFSAPGDTAPATVYSVESAGDALYTDFSQHDLEAMFRLFYERNIGAEVRLETLRFERFEGSSEKSGPYKAVLYEYSVGFEKAGIRQLVWAVETETDALTLTFTVSDPEAVNASVASIRIK